MNTFRLEFAIAWVALAMITGSAVAKRIAPKPVSPVLADGVRYSAEGDGRDQYIVAEDASSGKELWKVRLFHNTIKFWMEEDVQWVFITNLKLGDNSLFIRDERSRCYSIDLRRRYVKKQQCGEVFSQ